MRKRVGALLAGAYGVALVLFVASISLCVTAYHQIYSSHTAWDGWVRVDALGVQETLSYSAWSALKSELKAKQLQATPLLYAAPMQTGNNVLIVDGDFLQQACRQSIVPFSLEGVRSEQGLPSMVWYKKRAVSFDPVCELTATPLLEWTLEPFYMLTLETALRLNESLSIRTILVKAPDALSVVRAFWQQQLGRVPQLQVRNVQVFASELTQNMRSTVLQAFGVVLSLGLGLIFSTGFFWYRLVIRKESWLRYVFGQTPAAIQAGLRRQVRNLQWVVSLGAFIVVQCLLPVLMISLSLVGLLVLFFLSWVTPKILLMLLHPERYSYQMQRIE